MNANKQDVGGLPLLQFAVFDEFGKGADDRVWDYGRLCFEAGRELCRAAPAGGDVTGLHPATADLVARFAAALAEKLAAAERKYGYSDGWASPDWMDECRAKMMEHVAKGDPRDVAAYCAFLWHHGESTATAKVSAPAGSGEVDDAEAMREFTEYFVKNYPGPHTVIMDPNWHAPKIFRAAKRALLRKLQQGADYSFRVLEVGEVILEHDEYVNDYGQWAKVKPPFLGMAYMLNMRTVRRAASQGQEGV